MAEEDRYHRPINQNELSRVVTLTEGKKESISIAQVKEVMKLLFQELSKYNNEVILQLINKFRK